MKRIIATGAVIAAAALTTAGCGSSSASPGLSAASPVSSAASSPVSSAAVGSSPAQEIANKLVGTEDSTTGATVTSATVSSSSIRVCSDSTGCNGEPAADWNANGYYLGFATGEVQMSDGNQYVADIQMNPNTGAISWQGQS